MSKNKQQATWGGRFEDKPSDLMLQIGSLYLSTVD